MPPDQIGHMSLNGLRRRVATRDKTQNGTWMGMNRQLHWIHSTGFSASGAPMLSFHQLENCLLEYLWH
jgi:hypothetical protein